MKVAAMLAVTSLLAMASGCLEDRGGSSNGGSGGAHAAGGSGGFGGEGSGGDGGTCGGPATEDQGEWVDDACRSTGPVPCGWCEATYAEARDRQVSKDTVCAGTCGSWKVVYQTYFPYGDGWCTYDPVTGRLLGGSGCGDVSNFYCERSRCITYGEGPTERCKFDQLDRDDGNCSQAGAGGSGGSGS